MCSPICVFLRAPKILFSNENLNAIRTHGTYSFVKNLRLLFIYLLADILNFTIDLKAHELGLRTELSFHEETIHGAPDKGET